MRIKLDTNMPEAVGEFLRAQACDVDTVYSEGLSGATDPQVVAAARAEGRVLPTFDKGIANITDPAYAQHAGVILLRIKHPSVQSIVALLQTHFGSLRDQDLARRVAVISANGVRIR